MTFAITPSRHRTQSADAPAETDPADRLEFRIAELWQRSAANRTSPRAPADPSAPSAPSAAAPSPEPEGDTPAVLTLEDLPGASQLLPRLLRLIVEHPNRTTASFRPVVRRMIVDARFYCDAGDPVGPRRTEADTDRLTDRVLKMLDRARCANAETPAPELRRG